MNRKIKVFTDMHEFWRYIEEFEDNTTIRKMMVFVNGELVARYQQKK